ncbi:MAG: ATP-dependent RNA helicase HrpA [Chromatiales bacterium]
MSLTTFNTAAELHAALADCMIADRRRLLRWWHCLRTNGRLAEQFHRLLEQSRARAAARAAALPAAPQFAEELPVAARREELAAAIAENQVVIVCGETGSGKSTQLPKICLGLGRGVRGYIGHTQPRRLAARTLAARIAAELGSAVGAAVGYKVRFSEQLGENTYIKLMTDGILLAETQGDRRLDAYDTLIIDEAHERSLNIDFLLGYLKTLLPRRPDLKVVITSATIDPQSFSHHFNDAPVIEVSGRSYPVEIRYRPQQEDEETEETDINDGIVAAVQELSRIDRGDILVFLSGEREIRDAAKRLHGQKLADTDVLPLYARLTAGEQQRIFAPHRRRHIVLATNVAETSLTVPGVRYVIDTGLARISRYSPRTKVQRLPVEPVAQASADQRAGRCGRTAAGVCIRLYGGEDYAGRPRYTEPEIRRTNLAAVILQLQALGFGEVEEFPFLDPPELRYINDAYTLLYELGAVDELRGLTPLGRTLAQLPLDPRIARLVVAGHAEHCLNEILIIAAALSVQDPREYPLDQREAARTAQAVFNDERSDLLWYLNFWRRYEELAETMSKRRLAGFCREHFLAPARVREWRDTWMQLVDWARELGYTANREPAGYGSIHRALLAGYLSQIALRVDANTYQGTRNLKPAVFPGSTLFMRQPKWLVAAQMVETSRLYARTVAVIEPEWIERVGRHLLKRSYSEPHWDRRVGRVNALEKATLLGLTVTSGRRTDFGRIRPTEARDVFIREALVAGDIDTRAHFLAHNRALFEELKVFEHKARRLDVLADEQAIFDFYDQRIPEGICEQRTLEKWLLEAEKTDPDVLCIPRDYLLRAAPAAAHLFPDHLRVGGLDLPLSYRFEPGHEQDGVTVSVPMLALTQLDSAHFEWLVPGLLKEKIGLLIRSLPKAQRRRLVPVPHFVEACAARLKWGEGALRAELARSLSELTGAVFRADELRFDSLPEHLHMRFRVVDEKERVVAAERDLQGLQRKLGGSVRESFARVPGWTARTGKLTRWDFGDLPASVVIERSGTRVTGYPAIEDCSDGVNVRVMDTSERAQATSRQGLRRLFMLELASQVKYLRANLPEFRKMSLLFSPIGAAETLREDIIAAVFDRAFLTDATPVATQREFARRREQGRGQVVPTANTLCAVVRECLERAHALRQGLKAADKPLWRDTLTEIEAQLAALVYPGFVSTTPVETMQHLPRYLKAAALRLEKLARDTAKDRQRARQFLKFCNRYVEQRDKSAERPAMLEDYRWLLEEFRVSLFAQELGTAVPVSAARLDKAWDRIVGATSTVDANKRR